MMVDFLGLILIMSYLFEWLVLLLYMYAIFILIYGLSLSSMFKHLTKGQLVLAIEFPLRGKI